MSSLAKAYDPKAFEEQIAEQWESSGAFRADANSEKPAFTISMPPPNATGQLHVGHAVMLVLEDIFIRWQRPTPWLFLRLIALTMGINERHFR